MESHHPPIRSLILLGGQSSRTESPKYLLSMPSEISETGDDAPLLIHSLYLHHIFQVKHGDPLLRSVTLSVRDDEQCREIQALIERYKLDLPADLNINYAKDGEDNAGPSAGLIAAGKLDIHAHWLVTGCDYPRTSRLALEELRKSHRAEGKAVTCFVDSEGRPQPLFAIWTRVALKTLEAVACDTPDTSLESTLELLADDLDHVEKKASYSRGVTHVHPSTKNWLVSINTQEEWDQVVDTLQAQFSQSDS